MGHHTSRHARTAPRRAAGFTLIELCIVTAIIGVLASIAYPSFAGPLYKARRSDALVALMDLQMAQEQWRSGHGRYASQPELNAAPTSPQRHYQLNITNASTHGFDAVATATGVQAGDRGCQVLRLRVDRSTTVYASGPDANLANDEPTNKRCWSL